jgi:hypothetical protein
MAIGIHEPMGVGGLLTSCAGNINTVILGEGFILSLFFHLRFKVEK